MPGTGPGRCRLDLVFIRIIFVLLSAVCGYELQPLGLSSWPAAATGALFGAAVVLFEIRLRQVSLKRLIGAVIGSILGIIGAYLFSLVIKSSLPEGHTQSFLQLFVMLLMAYVGLVVGAGKGDLLNLAAGRDLWRGKQSKRSYKILDTSVIIDGRIAGNAETGFLDGTIVIPQFVLRELQLVADSADSMKRNRGPRSRYPAAHQKVPPSRCRLLRMTFLPCAGRPQADQRLAKVYEGKIVTNVQPEQVAQLQGVQVLNSNRLVTAETDRAAGEIMRLHPEGRQEQPGVAYLDGHHGRVRQCAQDDRQERGHLGHLGVADHGRKMIFGKFDERQPMPPRPWRRAGVPTEFASRR